MLHQEKGVGKELIISQDSFFCFNWWDGDLWMVVSIVVIVVIVEFACCSRDV